MTPEAFTLGFFLGLSLLVLFDGHMARRAAFRKRQGDQALIQRCTCHHGQVVKREDTP